MSLLLKQQWYSEFLRAVQTWAMRRHFRGCIAQLPGYVEKVSLKNATANFVRRIRYGLLVLFIDKRQQLCPSITQKQND